MKTISTLSLAAAMVLALSGCGGGGAKAEVSTQTLGQELTDLQQAYDTGAISESEYDKAKQSLLKKYR
jgi:hypothetical protein